MSMMLSFGVGRNDPETRSNCDRACATSFRNSCETQRHARPQRSQTTTYFSPKPLNSYFDSIREPSADVFNDRLCIRLRLNNNRCPLARWTDNNFTWLSYLAVIAAKRGTAVAVFVEHRNQLLQLLAQRNHFLFIGKIIVKRCYQKTVLANTNTKHART